MILALWLGAHLGNVAGPTNGIENFLAQCLKAVGEEPLRPTAEPALRIVSIPGFGDETIARFESHDGRLSVMIKTICPEILPAEGVDLSVEATLAPEPSSQPSRCSPGAVLRDEQQSIASTEWTPILALARKILRKDSHAPPRAASSAAPALFDGTVWLVEAVDGGRRRVIGRSSLQDPDFRDLACRVSGLAAIWVETGECGKNGMQKKELQRTKPGQANEPRR